MINPEEFTEEVDSCYRKNKDRQEDDRPSPVPQDQRGTQQDHQWNERCMKDPIVGHSIKEIPERDRILDEKGRQQPVSLAMEYYKKKPGHTEKDQGPV